MNTKSAAAILCGIALLWGATLLSAAETGGIAEMHEAAGIECVSCHGDNDQAIISNSTCLECHDSFEDIAQQTEDMHLNPHKSPHFLNLDCTSCHDGHKVARNFCQDCHGPIVRKK